MKIYKALLISFITLSLASCGALNRADVTKTSNEDYAPTNASSIEVFISDKPTKDYIEIGTVSVSRYKYVLMFPVKKPSEKVQLEMKEKTASIGGQAIINYRESGETNMTGTVIRFQ